jgi:preprotein translocase subunit SecE
MKFFNSIKNYIQESFVELMQKVSWPTWSELQSSAIVVMIATVIIAVVVLGMDMTFKNVIGFIYSIF